MNSFNHYAFGAVGEFLFTDIGGIRNDSIGFRKVRIAPQPGGGLTWAKTSYDSIRGRIASNWKIEGERLTLEVTVPPNVDATVVVPTSDPKSITVSDPAHAQRNGDEPGGVAYTVGSGSYTFVSTLR